VIGWVLGVLLVREFLWPNGFYRDDWQAHGAPGYLECGQALLEGSYPLISLRSWQGGALASEYVLGVFSPVVMGLSLICAILDLQAHQVPSVMVVVHVVILAWGMYELGLDYQLEPRLAAFLACSVPFNGFLIDWGSACWAPIVLSTAWLPWVWVSLRRAIHHGTRSDSRSLAAAGGFIFLLVTAGWPMTVIMAAILSAWLAGCAWWDREPPGLLGSLRRIAMAWSVGLLLSAPAWAMLMDGFSGSFRAGNTGRWEMNWLVTLPMWFGIWSPLEIHLINPFVPGTGKPYLWTELFTGSWPPWMLVLGAAWSHRNQRRVHWKWWILLAIAMAMASMPTLQPLRWSYRWLPLFVLVFNLMACVVWQEATRSFRAGGGPGDVRPLILGSAGALVFTLMASVQGWLLLNVRGTPFGFATYTGLAGFFIGWNLAVFIAVVLAARLGKPWRFLEGILIAGSLAGIAWVTWHGGGSAQWARRVWYIPPSHELARASALFSGRTILGVIEYRHAILTYHLMGPNDRALMQFGNLGMNGEAYWINGYSPSDTNGTAQLFGLMWNGITGDREAAAIALPLAQNVAGLEDLGIDAVIAPATWFTGWNHPEWEVLAQGETYLAWARKQPLPRLRPVENAVEIGDLRKFVTSAPAEYRYQAPVIERPGLGEPRVVAYSPARISGLRETRLSLSARVENLSAQRSSLLVTSRPWVPGYQATINGQPLPVLAASTAVVAVELPPGTRGLLKINYRPASLRAGLSLAAVGAAFFVWLWRRKPIKATAMEQDLPP
jgi:hypothetical protein